MPDNNLREDKAYKPLGRGLEDVSHLFLSNRRVDTGGEAATSRGPERHDLPNTAGRPAMVLLRSLPSSPTLAQIVGVLSGCDDALGERLRVIATGLPCDRAGEIDVLAADAANRLVIIEVETESGDSLLLRGILHFAWLTRNLVTLRRLYEGAAVDFSQPPRVVLVARRFPPLFDESVRRLAGPEIHCVRYHALDLALGAGIFFERLGEESVPQTSSSPSIVFT